MGYAVDTEATFDFVLEADKGKPEQSRPTLVFSFPSLRQYKKICKLMELDIVGAESLEVSVENLLAAIKVCLVDWRNQKVPFNVDDLDQIVTGQEAQEIRDRLLDEMTINENQKKSLQRQSVSNSVPAASQPVEDAATVPAKE